MKDRYKTYGANSYWHKHEPTSVKMERYLRNRPVSHLNQPGRRFDKKHKVMAVLGCVLLWLGVIALAVKAI